MTRMVAGTAPLQATPATTSHFLNLHRLQPHCQVEGLRLAEQPRHHMSDPLLIMFLVPLGRPQRQRRSLYVYLPTECACS